MCDMTHPSYCCLYVYDLTHLYLWRDSLMFVTWLTSITDLCNMTYVSLCRLFFFGKKDYFSVDMPPLGGCTCMCDMKNWLIRTFTKYVRHDKFIRVAWLIDTCARSLICVTLLIHVIWLVNKCGKTHSYAQYDSFMCVNWLIHMCDMTPSYVWHASFICVTRLIHMCDMPHSYVWHDAYILVTCHIHSCDITHVSAWYHLSTCVTDITY